MARLANPEAPVVGGRRFVGHAVATAAPAASSVEIEALLAFPRYELGRWPTPIDELETEHGTTLVKRDDLSGLGRGGAKARKIETLIGHMLATGHDELVTFAGNITNLGHDLLPPLESARIRATLLVVDEPPAARPLREELFAEILDEIHLLGPSRARAAATAVRAYVRGRRAGRRPLVVLPGASHPAAVVGNACGFIELVRQLEADGRSLPDVVFVTAATGNTLAGFLIAENALRATGRPPIAIVGVQVHSSPLRAQVLALQRWTERFLGLTSHVPHGRVRVDSSQLHGGFGSYPESLASMCERLRRDVGLAIDPIFGGKTWAAMEAFRRCGGDAATVLYWHCGYTPEWRELVPANRKPRQA